ncbi:hypothetical protein [Polynucleobacter sp. HIN5]|uniref:hypothetical protein n=1 Tax=Polynucleobacter sp. HIN5 TaxID=3047864 RepID=UPI0025744BAA|nr:hypothetical protein [Polynucleobacter sp. HIN5]BEI34200.1 hypothetical protein PHIN5_15680 [Polynucleobacter sp. HIN5]
MKKLYLLLSLLFLLVGCTTSQEIKRVDGESEFLIGCGAATGWNICYQKANEICPNGYRTISEVGGFNRKELRVSCPKSNTNK